MVSYQNTAVRPTYIQLSTSNLSFVKMHNYLKDVGIKNNAFFLALVDPDLAGVDPRDPRLNLVMKRKILKECMTNYWYFIREVVRIPDQGGSINSGKQFELHRGNLALNFCIINNWNVFAEFPRQQGKTIAVVCRLLWEFLFNTTNSEMMFINKKHEDSKLNLQRLRDIRHVLPSYLKMTELYGKDGKKIKNKNSVEVLEHPLNGNKIKTLASARNKVLANSLGRGCTQPRQWYDEYAFILYNKLIYLSATPAYKTAAKNAKLNGAPYGIIITTTPGDLTTDHGMDAYQLKDSATKFNEGWYDLKQDELNDIVLGNQNSSFVYIRFNYKQLGKDEKWFKEQVIDLRKDYDAIRREVLLEWSKASDNSPFRKEDLKTVKALLKDPITTLRLGKGYFLNIYEQMNNVNRQKYPPIIGVDVSGGYKRDSSAITIIDSLTTKVIADLNCNYISTTDLASVIHELVTKYLPNAVVNIERNGGYGSSVLSKLIKTSVKFNLFYEIKDKVIEERFNGQNLSRKTVKTKVYGLDSSKNTRELLMQILRERMEYHKDKFISPIIHKELETLEIKKNGKIEHTSTGHDDQVFSYLMALYVWYEGKDILERWGIQKRALKTDEDLEQAIVSLEDQCDNIISELENSTETSDMINSQLEALNDHTMQYDEWLKKEQQLEQECVNQILSNKITKDAYLSHYSLDPNDYNDTQIYNVPNSLFEDFYK